MAAGSYKPIAVLLVSACIFAAPIYLGGWAAKVSGCPLLQVPGSYMAYCSEPRYGDFEHLAYGLGLVPEAVESLKRADVVMLGNSRTQVAFSTKQVDDYFRSRSIRYHVLGFGYGEYGEFPAYIFRKYQLSPRVVIINTDPFFTDEISTAGKAALSASALVWADALMKRTFESIHSYACSALCWWHEAWSKPGSIYRSFETGQWLWSGYGTYDTRHFRDGDEIKPSKPIEDAEMQKYYDAALKILPSFNVPKECIILTGIPTPPINSDEIAASLAKRLGVARVQPAVAGMRSGDVSHLTMASAERWAPAFLADADATIKRCLEPRSAQ